MLSPQQHESRSRKSGPPTTPCRLRSL
jgi:hypothetical protein